MIRIVVFALVAANLLYFGWSRWVGNDTAALTAVAVQPRAPRPAPPPPPPAPPPCATIGPFNDEALAAQAEQQLAAAGWGILRRTGSEQVREGWWVYVAHADDRAQARTLNAIRRAGIQDAFAMPDDPEHRVSVGIFSEEERAEDRAQRVQRLQLDAVVTERQKTQPVIWFDVPGVARATLADGRLAATGLVLERLRIEDCPPAPAPAGVAPSGEAPSDGGEGTAPAQQPLPAVQPGAAAPASPAPVSPATAPSSGTASAPAAR